jgi:hypothetical protein
VGDAIIVATTGGAPAYAVPMHATTALLMLALAALMLRRSSSAHAGTAGTIGTVGNTEQNPASSPRALTTARPRETRLSC